MAWPTRPDDLRRVQRRLAAERPAPWVPPTGPVTAGACFVCFERGLAGAGAAGDPGWAAAVTWREGALLAGAVVTGPAGSPYEPGLLTAREGPLLEAATSRLRARPDVLLVDATGRDHPRGAGLAVHLGAVLGIPTVGVTHRPLTATGGWPPDEVGATMPLTLAGEVVGSWVRTRRGARPLAVHAGWRTSPATAVDVVLAVAGRSRTPEPLRLARRFAREARADRRAAEPVSGLPHPPEAR